MAESSDGPTGADSDQPTGTDSDQATARKRAIEQAIDARVPGPRAASTLPPATAPGSAAPSAPAAAVSPGPAPAAPAAPAAAPVIDDLLGARTTHWPDEPAAAKAARVEQAALTDATLVASGPIGVPAVGTYWYYEGAHTATLIWVEGRQVCTVSGDPMTVQTQFVRFRQELASRGGGPDAAVLAATQASTAAPAPALPAAALAAAAEEEETAGPATGGVLHVVAHEDDDLLFTSPDLLDSADSGQCVRTVYLTAGDAGMDETYWGSREEGVEAAYAQLLDRDNTWTTSTQSFASKDIRVRTLDGTPEVTLLFLRLPDGFPLGTGSQRYGYQGLEKLLWGTIGSISANDGSATYTADELRATLTAIMDQYLPDEVRTTDFTGSYGDGDHSDHHAAAYLAHDASDAYFQAHQITAYLGYPATARPENVFGDDLDRKKEVYYTYAAFDDQITHGPQDEAWVRRQYAAASATTGAQIVASAGDDQAGVVGQEVTLDGSNSTGEDLSYSWTETSGPPVTLSDPTAEQPSFTPTQPGPYVFTLTVAGDGATSTDTVNVLITTAS